MAFELRDSFGNPIPMVQTDVDHGSQDLTAYHLRHFINRGLAISVDVPITDTDGAIRVNPDDPITLSILQGLEPLGLDNVLFRVLWVQAES